MTDINFTSASDFVLLHVLSARARHGQALDPNPSWPPPRPRAAAVFGTHSHSSSAPDFAERRGDSSAPQSKREHARHGFTLKHRIASYVTGQPATPHFIPIVAFRPRLHPSGLCTAGIPARAHLIVVIPAPSLPQGLSPATAHLPRITHHPGRLLLDSRGSRHANDTLSSHGA